MNNNKIKKKFILPASVAEAAKKGLYLRKKFKCGGTEIGKNRAKQLRNRMAISISDIKRISSYFVRHEVDKKAENFGNDDNPSRGYLASLLWGGDAGKEWVESLKEKNL
ncbi:MAG: hypothetical protein RCO49_06745 [Rickettsia endosymbiont of Argas persicus]